MSIRPRRSGDADEANTKIRSKQDRNLIRGTIAGAIGMTCGAIAKIPACPPVLATVLLTVTVVALLYLISLFVYTFFLSGRRFWVLYMDRRHYKKWLATGSPEDHVGRHHAPEGRHHTDPES